MKLTQMKVYWVCIKERMYVKGCVAVYKQHEKRLIWLAFIIAGIMLLSIIGRIFGS